MKEEKQCHWCAMTVPLKAKGCPYCRKKQSLFDRVMDRVFWGAILIVLIALLGSVGRF